MNRTLSNASTLATPSRSSANRNSHGGMNSSLPQQGDLPRSFRDTIANLAKDLLHRVINLASPDVRDDAVRARIS